jgi:hypothetical protein
MLRLRSGYVVCNMSDKVHASGVTPIGVVAATAVSDWRSCSYVRSSLCVSYPQRDIVADRSVSLMDSSPRSASENAIGASVNKNGR